MALVSGIGRLYWGAVFSKCDRLKEIPPALNL